MLRPKHSRARSLTTSCRKVLRLLRRESYAALAALSIAAFFITRLVLTPDLAPLIHTNDLHCVGWRATIACSPFGEHYAEGDRRCEDVIVKGSGYCECSDRWVTNLRTCGLHRHFTCGDACAAMEPLRPGTMRLPNPLVCASDVKADGTAAEETERLLPPKQEALTDLWEGVQRAVRSAGQDTVRPPGSRTNADDWVMRGIRMPKDHVAAARRQWQAFLSAAPGYPQGQFRHRGIAIVSGSTPHMVPTWVTLHMLRRTGSVLRVELWFLEAELPTKRLGAALQAKGAKLCVFPRGVERLGGFALKAAALLLSGFEEVLLLDSDNMPVRDPALLFDSPLFAASGALLWPDYWDSAAAPDAAGVLALPAGTVLPGGSFESGQMLFNKRRMWRAIQLAAFMNIHSALYYELLTNFMGKGDKETFAFAVMATNGSYALVPTPAGSAGIMKMHCNKHQTHCWQEFAGNTMVQHDLQGSIMFLHTNFRPKWNLQLPDDFREYRRRWQMLQPGSRSFQDVLFLQLGGRDPEAEAVAELAALECSPWLTAYLRAMGAPAREVLRGFHPLHNGMDFRRPYRWGISGPYLDFTGISLGDRLKKLKRQLKHRGLI